MSAPETAHLGHSLNRTWWDEVTPVHARSEMYDTAGFLAGRCALDRLELDWLGDVAGKRVLHLQCHFGQSTLEIARRGAAEVVGVDFSSVAVATARNLAAQMGLSDRAHFVESDVLLLDDSFPPAECGGIKGGRYDIIFTSYGVITWLSDLNRWGEVIGKFLAPQGKFVIVELHPSLMMFDWENGKLERKYGYFHCPNGIAMPPAPDYADNSYVPKSPTLEWQWSLADVFRALHSAGLTVRQFEEYPLLCFKPYPILIEAGPGLYRLPDGEPEIPMTFALEATW